ncbi:hypothetical protein N7495_003566 [Penicillium taxi]|uniref:uncharacterized protein n=1 Tax=Penicillium taxi TaxID=168475 RepID=UPI0025455A35|nr:uncharacterized protein N7495_003566 [Penicillium taxi]KAJ5898822.1 hypothetical protein N7495_003566 [Penicillium taxi]
MTIPKEYKDVPTAELSTIRFINLFDKDKSELRKLIAACENDGFFYLDLESSGSEKFWADLYEIDSITKKWFSQSTDVKLKTPTVSLAHGLVGLQVFSSEDATWKYVEPRPGHAIINVGDTLRFLSNKQLRSALHRVLPLGRVQTEDRYSISYFLRASDSTEFEDSNGDDSSAKK